MLQLISALTMAYLLIAALGLCATTQVLAAHSMSSSVQARACTDPQQPATLDCAPAPSAQFDGTGRLWIVWSYGGHVYLSSSDDQGKTIRQSVVVNRIPERISARGENRPKIAIAPSGAIYISWTTPLARRYTGNVRFSYSTDNGRNFSQPITINDNLDITGHRFEALSVNKQGTIFMAWLDKRDRFKAGQKGQKYRGAALYYSYSVDGGKSFKPNKNIMAHSCECCRVVMAIDNDQMPVIMWRNIYDTNTRDHSLVKLINNETPGTVVRVSHDNWKVDACPHHGPAISIGQGAAEGGSLYHLVWFNNAPERHGIFYAKITDPNKSSTKNILSKVRSVGEYTQGAAHADVLSLGDQVWLVWKQFDGEQESVWQQYSANNGDDWQPAKIVAQAENGSDHPFLIHFQEQVYLQWHSRDNGFVLYLLN